MASLWEVEFLDEFIQTSEKYMARYEAPSENLDTEMQHLPPDPLITEGQQLVDSVAEAYRLLEDEEYDLNPCKRGPVRDTRDLGYGPWLVVVLVQFRPSKPHRAVVLSTLHTNDLTNETLDRLIQKARKKFKQWPQKRKNDQI